MLDIIVVYGMAPLVV